MWRLTERGDAHRDYPPPTPHSAPSLSPGLQLRGILALPPPPPPFPRFRKPLICTREGVAKGGGTRAGRGRKSCPEGESKGIRVTLEEGCTFQLPPSILALAVWRTGQGPHGKIRDSARLTGAPGKSLRPFSRPSLARGCRLSRPGPRLTLGSPPPATSWTPSNLLYKTKQQRDTVLASVGGRADQEIQEPNGEDAVVRLTSTPCPGQTRPCVSTLWYPRERKVYKQLSYSDSLHLPDILTLPAFMGNCRSEGRNDRQSPPLLPPLPPSPWNCLPHLRRASSERTDFKIQGYTGVPSQRLTTLATSRPLEVEGAGVIDGDSDGYRGNDDSTKLFPSLQGDHYSACIGHLQQRSSQSHPQHGTRLLNFYSLFSPNTETSLHLYGGYHCHGPHMDAHLRTATTGACTAAPAQGRVVAPLSHPPVGVGSDPLSDLQDKEGGGNV
ncbi:uncharacterized protein LOC123642470 [Lemur catta]|uniref:uncharacterized protein LOC123642470 n=1 Tax=Lemur catta TaxID=9447 RepID=UPI001E26E3FF|nr:uncharacterized protein LOC123642470 [Lemur catta]